MVNLFEADLVSRKSLRFAIRKVYGIGQGNADTLCKKLGISNNLKVNDLTDEKLFKITKTIENKQQLKKNLNSIYSFLDKGKKKNVFHKNMIAKKKAKLASYLKIM